MECAKQTVRSIYLGHAAKISDDTQRKSLAERPHREEMDILGEWNRAGPKARQRSACCYWTALRATSRRRRVRARRRGGLPIDLPLRSVPAGLR